MFFFYLYRMYTSSSGAHSRASSLAEDNESYVPMHPTSGHYSSFHQPILEDYSQPATASTSTTRGGDISSATSSCSITSGTPSTDIRFSEYHLEKVHACFTPSEEDELLDRPPRTWSVGSKLEHSKRKHHIDRVANESLRHRAYSVGSRIIKNTSVKQDGASGSQSGSHTPSHNSPVAINHHHEINNNNSSSSGSVKNKKSSSAPILAQSIVGRTSHSSFEHMGDLMEIDFTQQRSGDDLSGSNLMEIDYSNRNHNSSKSSPVNIPNKSNEDYINMSCNSKSNTPSNYVDMRPNSRRLNVDEESDYMVMSKSTALPGRSSSSSTPLSSSPMKARTNPLMPPPSQSQSNYVDMSPRSYENHMRSRARVTSKSLTKDFPKQSSVPDGYMEMSFKKPSATVSANLRSNENPSSSSDEYINMDFSNNNDVNAAGTNNSSLSAKDRSMSRPITIQKRHSSSMNEKIVKSGSADGPPAFLPLNNPMTASISPTRSSNRMRCDSRDSGIVTPSSGSQATIFPFSPGSPMKQFEPHDDQSLPRKNFMDSSNSSSNRLNEDDTIEEEPRTPVPIGMQSNVETLSSDYAVMNLGEPVSKKPNLAATPIQSKTPSSSSSSSHFLLETDSENHDYINCTPTNMATAQQLPQSKLVTPKPINLATSSLSESGDYALMNPIKASAALSPGPGSQKSDTKDDIPPRTSAKKSLSLTLSSHEKLNNSNSCFKPIVEDSHHHQPHQFQRHLSERGASQTSNNNDSGYEILARPSLSRPNSVNSEKIKSTAALSSFLSNRPSSANSERLALSSTSSSTSTLCESQNSSSQTLRNLDASSAVPSPMSLTSRPESVSSDIHMVSRPPSVTSERELHYASLDLPPCSSTNPLNQTTPQKMDVDQRMDMTSPNQASSSSSSASSQQSQSVFTYAQIDFNKSEQLRAQNQQHQQHQTGGKK
jgi:insulin receptor substrate 1